MSICPLLLAAVVLMFAGDDLGRITAEIAAETGEPWVALSAMVISCIMTACIGAALVFSLMCIGLRLAHRECTMASWNHLMCAGLAAVLVSIGFGYFTEVFRGGLGAIHPFWVVALAFGFVPLLLATRDLFRGISRRCE